MNYKLKLILTGMFVSIFPFHSAMAAEDCAAPSGLDSTINRSRSESTGSLSWDAYEMTDCNADEELNSYKIQVKTVSGKVLYSELLTDTAYHHPYNFASINAADWGYNRVLKFRVKAIGDAGTETPWSTYTEFTTQPYDVGFRDTVLGSQNEAGMWSATMQWKPVPERAQEKFVRYVVKVVEIKRVHTHSSTYNERKPLYTTTISDPATSSFNLGAVIRDYQTDDVKPFDTYTYKVSVMAVYEDEVRSARTYRTLSVVDGGLVDTL